ncbi:MAG: metallophosphoesterase, partial [Deltaproteobacteria bacterium CG_4_10_14_0_2_um_filter_43_8]
MNILAIGDIFGRPGRAALKALLPGLIKKYSPDFVVANIENAAGGRGVTQKVAEELSVCPVDIFTSGNHIWDHKTFLPFLDRYSILRPANVKGDLPGFGFGIYPSKNNKRIGVINLQGRVFMEGKGPELDNPFDVCEKILSDMKSRTDCILIDFHAETTSEKKS